MVVALDSLDEDALVEILTKPKNAIIKQYQSLFKMDDVELEFTDDAVKAAAADGFDDIYGARPLKRSIQTKIEDPISEKMLDGSLKSGDHLVCGFEDGKFTFRTE